MEAEGKVESSSLTWHTVKPDETLDSIARDYGLSVASVARSNDLPDGAAIMVGQKLRIPRFDWFAVTTYSNYEMKVKGAIIERAKAEGLETMFGRILIPQEEVADVIRGKRRISKRSFFPGYLFVEMQMNEETWELVRNTPKVTNFVGGRKPTPVPMKQIESILTQMQEGAVKPAPRVIFDEGDNVRVIDGPFTNFTGVVDEVRAEKQKLRVLVSIFGRSTPVELEYHQVEKT